MSPDLTTPFVDSCRLFAMATVCRTRRPTCNGAHAARMMVWKVRSRLLLVTLFIGMQHGHPVQAVSERAPLLDLAVVLLQAQRVAPTQPSFQTARPAN